MYACLLLLLLRPPPTARLYAHRLHTLTDTMQLRSEGTALAPALNLAANRCRCASCSRYKTVILQEPLPEEGIQAVLDYASSGPRGTRVFAIQALGGATKDVPKLATAATNLRTADAILVLRANSRNESEALDALHKVGARQYISLAVAVCSGRPILTHG